MFIIRKIWSVLTLPLLLLTLVTSPVAKSTPDAELTSKLLEARTKAARDVLEKDRQISEEFSHRF